MRIMRTALAVMAAAALGLSACGTSTSGTGEPSESPTQATSGATDTPTDDGSEKPSEEPSDGGSEGNGEVPKGDGTQTIYLVSKGFQHRFWQAVREGAEQAGKEYNYDVKFVGPQAETQVTEQLNMLQTALDTKPAAIGLAALDSGAAADLLDQIKAANIPIIAFDSGVDSDIPVTTVSTDNYAAAQEAAKKMVELIGGKGTVGLVCHDQTSQTGKQRCDGFKDYMETVDGVTVLPEQIAGEVGLAANAAKSMIQANPDMVGIYGSNEAAAGGVVQGASEVGTEITVIGFDSGKTQLDAIREGRAAGAITQSPVKMGYETVVAAIKAINGQQLEKNIDSGFAWYDKDNMDDPEIAANLYE